MGAPGGNQADGRRTSGLFELKTAADLYKKLQADRAAVQADPTDAYAAFNFFVTGWCLLEWLIPESERDWQDKRKALRAARPILDVCRDLATGAKRVEPRPTDDAAAADGGRGGTPSLPSPTWDHGTWPPSAWAADLVIHLEGAPARQYGERLDLPVFVDLVMEAWAWIFADPAS